VARPKSLTSISLDLLLKMRDDVSAALSQKATALKKELSALGHDYAEVGRIAVYGRKEKSALSGRKVPPKYRDPKTRMTWAGRGAQPLWLREALKRGKKLDSFLIDKPRRVKRRKTKVAAKRPQKAGKKRPQKKAFRRQPQKRPETQTEAQPQPT
jgi:DNA-binding protein H-NS